MDAADMWASLPSDLLMEILRPLDSTAVFRCAAACKPWRRAITRNASCLGPRPALLLGFFHTSRYVHHPMRPRHASPGPFVADVLAAASAVSWTSYAALFQTRSPAAPFFVPPPPASGGHGGGGIGVALYARPLSSRDGFVLLGGRAAAADLCLCDAVTGSCRILPAAAPEVSDAGASYVLVTGDGDDSGVVRILAVKHGEDVKAGMTYQVFSTASGGTWGPVERSARLEDEGVGPAYRNGEPKDVVVVRGSVVYWLGVSSIAGGGSRQRRRAFAVDVRARRAWTTALPEKYVVLDRRTWYSSLALATSGDGQQLSLVVSLPTRARQIELWMLVGNGHCMLRRTIEVQNLLHVDRWTVGPVWLRTFCPRIGKKLGGRRAHSSSCTPHRPMADA